MLGINPEAYFIDVLRRVDDHPARAASTNSPPHGWEKVKEHVSPKAPSQPYQTASARARCAKKSGYPNRLDSEVFLGRRTYNAPVLTVINARLAGARSPPVHSPGGDRAPGDRIRAERK